MEWIVRVGEDVIRRRFLWSGREDGRGIGGPASQDNLAPVTDLMSEFPTEDSCIIKEARWPDGLTTCDKCHVERKHYRVTGRTAYACDHCGNHIYPLAGTIFEKTTTPLRTWFYAMFMIGSTRCGVSAKQLQRETGVTYKTAWRMFKQIRTLMSEDTKLGGSTVEMDETYVGGRRRYHFGTAGGRPGAGDRVKTPAFGMVERGGRVVAKVTKDVKAATVYPIVAEYVMPATTVYTDEFAIYDRLATGENKFTHRRIRHAEKIYVMGDVHTNTIEGFWSLVKRGIGGVYHSVSKEYLQSYLDEYSFRYNHRKDSQPMFVSLLGRVSELAE